MIRGRECPVTQSSQALWLFEQGSRSGSWWGIPAPYALSRASVVLAQTCRMTSSTYPQLLSASALVGGIAFAPYSDTGHANPALCGLTAGHAHEGMPLSGFIPFLDVLPRGVFRPRGTRDGGVVLIPTLTVRKKTAMHLFCGGKKDSTMTVLPWYEGAESGLTPTAATISNSCYLVKISSLYLGTVLTLRRGRSIANR